MIAGYFILPGLLKSKIVELVENQTGVTPSIADEFFALLGWTKSEAMHGMLLNRGQHRDKLRIPIWS